MIEPNPITYRMLHEHAAEMGLCAEFFSINGIDPDAPVECNCNFDEGHEPGCYLVHANFLRKLLDPINKELNALPWEPPLTTSKRDGG